MEQSRLYPYFLSRWYFQTIEVEQLEKAVLKGYITQTELDDILKSEYQGSEQ